MRILVTGGGGYLGCWVTRRLLECGHSVRVFDRFCFGRTPLSDVETHPSCEVIQGDVRRLQETPSLLDEIDAVAHLASVSNDPSCDLNEDMAYDVNVLSTVELARQASQRGVRRFVLASSCAVYGRGVFEVVDEQSVPQPVATFGRMKLEAENALLELFSGSFEPAVARAATLFGFSPRMRFDLAVNLMVASAQRAGIIEVHGGGNQWRPFVHVQDAAEAIRILLEAPARLVSGEVFNVGADAQNRTIRELAEQVIGRLGSGKIEIPKEDDDLRNFHVSFDKIRSRFGFQCLHTIDDGIDEVRDWILANRIDSGAPLFSNVQTLRRLRDTPVELGGEPIAARFIPLARPSLGAEEEAAVVRSLRSGWLTSGPQITAFEKAFAETVQVPHTVAVSSCTAALHLCMVALGVRPGDEVITSPITWASTGNTILNMGARPVFADVDPHTMNVTPESIEAAVTEKTRLIMPVHMAGHPCDLDPILELGRRLGIPVVEDAAHALGAGYKGVAVGAHGVPACFSFYAIKNITTMEGGMISLKDAELATRLRLLASNGMAASAWDRYSRSAVAGPQEVVTPGFKYALSNVGAAMGLEQLKKFPAFKAARARLAALYRTVLEDLDEIELPEARGPVEHAWHLFIIRLRLDRLSRSRDEIAFDLRRENIGTGIHFYGLHLHRYYRETLGMRPEDLPNATKLSNEVLSLPLHPQLSEKDVRDVVAALKKVLHHARRTP